MFTKSWISVLFFVLGLYTTQINGYDGASAENVLVVKFVILIMFIAVSCCFCCALLFKDESSEGENRQRYRPVFRKQKKPALNVARMALLNQHNTHHHVWLGSDYTSPTYEGTTSAAEETSNNYECYQADSCYEATVDTTTDTCADSSACADSSTTDCCNE